MLDIQFTGLEKLKAVMNPKIAIQATTWALNRTAKNAITAGDKEVRERNAIKKKDITKALKTKKATDINQVVAILISGTKISLISFGAKQTKKGVTFRVKRKEKRKLIPGAFKAKSKFSEAAYLRSGREAYPIRALSAQSVAEMFKAEEVIAAMDKRIAEMFPKNFDSRYTFLINKAAAKAAAKGVSR